jgi:hypothetical protein
VRDCIHEPVNLPAFVVVLADLGVEATIDAVFEDVPCEREDHRGVFCVLHDVFVRPGSRVGFDESPRRGFDEAADVGGERIAVRCRDGEKSIWSA